MPMKHHNNTCFGKGKTFESAVEALLKEAKRESRGTMTYAVRPKLRLQNGERVIPDFRVRIELPHKQQQILIECQNRNRSSKSVLHKIQHIRAKSNAHTFFFVHARKIGTELARAFEAEGIEHCSLAELRRFLQEESRYTSAIKIAVTPLRSARPELRVRALQLNSHPDAHE